MTDVRLYYEEAEEGESLILIHGYPLNHKIWQPIIPFLGKGIRAILPDLRGCGKSPAGPVSNSMKLMAEDVIRLMDELRISTSIVAGHSMGGYVILKLAESFPDRIKGIAMVSSQAVADTPEKKEGRAASIKLINSEGINPIINGMLPRLTETPELIEPIRQIMSESNPAGLIGCLTAMADRDDANDWLHSIIVPALVIAGRNDKIIPIERSIEMNKSLVHSELVVMEHSCHMPMMEQPQETANAFQSLVKRVKK